MRILIFSILWLFSFGTLFGDVVENELTSQLLSLFPEIERGYIDLNRNGQMDQNDEVDEIIPESVIIDSLLQGKEILDFIINYYEYIDIEKLEGVENALTNAQETIPELIALNYTERIKEVVGKKRELEAKGLYLTPTERRIALAKIENLLGVLLNAYKREDREYEQDFEDAQSELFTMIERGYPIPDAYTEEEKDILVSIMINTVIKRANDNLPTVSAAIKTLGKLKAASASEYLIDLLQNPTFRRASIKALGDIGSQDALDLLLAELDQETDEAVKIEIILSIGKIGSQESLNYLLNLAKKENTDSEMLKAVLESLVGISEKGATNTSLQAVFNLYLESAEPELRILAIRGLKNFRYTATSEKLSHCEA